MWRHGCLWGIDLTPAGVSLCHTDTLAFPNVVCLLTLWFGRQRTSRVLFYSLLLNDVVHIPIQTTRLPVDYFLVVKYFRLTLLLLLSFIYYYCLFVYFFISIIVISITSSSFNQTLKFLIFLPYAFSFNFFFK